MKFWQKVLLFCSKKEILAKIIAEMELPQCNKPRFSLILVIIGVTNTQLSQKIWGENPWFPERLELFPGLVCSSVPSLIRYPQVSNSSISVGNRNLLRGGVKTKIQNKQEPA